MLRRVASSLPRHEPCSGGFPLAGQLAQAMVDTVREPLLLLDAGLRVVVASRSFYQTFAVAPEDAVGRKLYELGSGEWSILRLRNALAKILYGRSTMEVTTHPSAAL